MKALLIILILIFVNTGKNYANNSQIKFEGCTIKYPDEGYDSSIVDIVYEGLNAKNNSISTEQALKITQLSLYRLRREHINMKHFTNLIYLNIVNINKKYCSLNDILNGFASSSKITTIRISDCLIDSIPKIINQYKNIESLSINMICPIWFNKEIYFKNLTSLKISTSASWDNSYRYPFPHIEELAKYDSMLYLYIKNNSNLKYKLEPPFNMWGIGDDPLIYMESIYSLSENNISDINNIKALSWQSFESDTLPYFIANFKNLECLFISNSCASNSNTIKYLPCYLTNLPKLKEIQIYGKDIKHVCPELDSSSVFITGRKKKIGSDKK